MGIKKLMQTVIGFFGVARAGKSTAAQLSANILQRAGVNAVVRSFASPIRDGLAEMGIVKDTHPHLYRKAAQLIGTELCREEDPNWWIKQMQYRINKLDQDSVVLIDDCRFENEFDFIRSQNGTLVFIAAGDRVNLTEPMYSHSSETIAVAQERYWRAIHQGVTIIDTRTVKPDFEIANTGELSSMVSLLNNLLYRLKQDRKAIYHG